MPTSPQIYKVQQPTGRLFTWADGLVLVILASLVYIGVRLAYGAPTGVAGPEISLDIHALPWYAAMSIIRMTAAYCLSILFSLVYGRLAAFNRFAERALIPLLDVLQSIPILSFLPVILLSLTAILPRGLAVELASIGLIFTSMTWNITYSWYQSLTTLPVDLLEANAIFRLNVWFRFKLLELPFAAIGLIWNSMMSWAGGWFFLMAAEIFTIGDRDFRLPGLGSYLHEAANQENFKAVLWGLMTLVVVIVVIDQLIWRPLLVWSVRFKVEMVGNEDTPSSWFFGVVRTSRLVNWLRQTVFGFIQEGLDQWMLRRLSIREQGSGRRMPVWMTVIMVIIFSIAIAYAGFHASTMLASLHPSEWKLVGIGLAATFLRVAIALLLAMLWTIPVGVWIGTNIRLSAFLQPAVQILASIPATALFPVMLLFFSHWVGGLNIAAILLMLVGTQWYLLFNIIAGASTIPQDLKYTSILLQLKGWQYWKTLILPALFPFIITGAITAAGGAWNASIVAEYVSFGGKTLQVTGIGSTIAQATVQGNYPLLLAGTLSMILSVVLINRFVWRRLYRLANEKYRME